MCWAPSEPAHCTNPAQSQGSKNLHVCNIVFALWFPRDYCTVKYSVTIPNIIPVLSLGLSYFPSLQYAFCWLGKCLNFFPAFSAILCQHWLTFLVSANAQFPIRLSTIYLFPYSSLSFGCPSFPFRARIHVSTVRSCSWIGAPSSYQISSFKLPLFPSWAIFP